MIITPIYSGLLVLLLVALSLNVIRLRRANKIGHGDGGIKPLQQAIAAQSNASQYIPLAIVLLALLEWQQVYSGVLHLMAAIFLVGRLLHAYGMLAPNIQWRVVGMHSTLWTLMGLSGFNIVWPFVGQ